jgi:hypothetical protein
MKKVFVFVGIVFSMLIIVCSNNETPTQVARKFFYAVEKGNKRTAEQLLAPQYLKDLDWDDNDLKEEVVKLGKIISITEQQVFGIAYVTVTFENDKVELKIMKVDDKWRITKCDWLEKQEPIVFLETHSVYSVVLSSYPNLPEI